MNTVSVTLRRTLWLALVCASAAAQQPVPETAAERVDKLIAQMTLEEKVSQLGHVADAIPRLGVPAYNWWNEGLHGVARAGVATVFPE